MKVLKSALSLLLIVAAFGLAMFGLNFYTGPLAEANRAGDALAPLLAVMPEGSSFDSSSLLYDSADPASSSLTNVSAQVLKVYQEATGKGFAIQCQTEGNYSGDPMSLTFGVDAEGKITGIQIDTYTDSIDVRTKGESFLPSFVGQDSTLADVTLVAGCTISSSSIRNAVLAGMEVLTANNLVSAGVKTPTQILTELISTVAPGMTQEGVLKATEIAASGSVETAYQANNGSGFAFILKEGENSYLAVVNAMGTCRLYDVEATDVTDAHEALVQEAVAAAKSQKDYSADLEKKLKKLYEGASDLTSLSLDTFSTVVSAIRFQANGASYTAFYCRPVGFDQMDIYVVVDETGAIHKLDAKQLFFETEYFPVANSVKQPEYKAGFEGITSDSFAADTGMIAGATMTSGAVRQAVTDSFAAFAQIQNGGN